MYSLAYCLVFRCKASSAVICELRTGELVICELIVQTTDANLGYNANQKVQTFYAIKRGFCIRNAEITTCPLRRKLSALYWAYVYAYVVVVDIC